MKPRKLLPGQAVIPDTPTAYQDMFCYDQKVNLEDIANDIEEGMGLSLMARNAGEQPEGSLTAQYSPGGSRTASWCGKLIERGQEHTCVVVSVYAEPNESSPTKNRVRAAGDKDLSRLKGLMDRTISTPVVKKQR